MDLYENSIRILEGDDNTLTDSQIKEIKKIMISNDKKCDNLSKKQIVALWSIYSRCEYWSNCILVNHLSLDSFIEWILVI